MRPPLDEVFHEIIELSLRPEGFVHGGGRDDLSEVAARLGVPADSIDASYIVDGLKEYWDRNDKVEVLFSEKHGDVLIEVFVCTVIDPVTKKKYRQVVVVGKGPSGEYYEFRPAHGLDPYREAAALAWSAKLVVKGRRADKRDPPTATSQ